MIVLENLYYPDGEKNYRIKQGLFALISPNLLMQFFLIKGKKRGYGLLDVSFRDGNGAGRGRGV